VIPPTDFEVFRAVRQRAKLYVLVTHVNPTATRSVRVGLGRYLMSLGFEVRIVNQDETPHVLHFRVRWSVREATT
jgi:hypothetical protein